MSKVTDAADIAVSIAADDSHGYNSVNRDGNPDYDYISFVCTCLTQAGIPFPYENITTTQEFIDAALGMGFIDVTDEIEIGELTRVGIRKGDVVIHYQSGGYTYGDMIAIAQEDDTDILTEATANENRVRDASGQPGDQIETEIYNEGTPLPYDLVLRYPAVAVNYRTPPVHVGNSYIQSVVFDFSEPASYTVLENLDTIKTIVGIEDLQPEDVMISGMNADRNANGQQIRDIQWQGDRAVIIFDVNVTGNIRITYMVSVAEQSVR